MVISIHDHSLYGIACIQCGQTLIAPDCSRYVRSRIVRHAWSCESCGVRFETSDHLRLDAGVISIEQVLNVLSRLNELPIPEQVATHLKLNEEPLADTARYDSLHDQEVAHV